MRRPKFMGLFEIKIVSTMVLMAAGIFLVSVYLARDMLNVSTSIARKRSQEIFKELKESAVFYRELVETRKRLFEERGRKYALLIGNEWKAFDEKKGAQRKQMLRAIFGDDEDLGVVRVLDSKENEIVSLRLRDDSFEEFWRIVHISTPLEVDGGKRGEFGPKLELGFLISKKLEEQYQRLGDLQMEAPHLQRLAEEMQPRYFPLLIKWFAISIGFVTLVGLLMARRVTRRVTRLTRATAQVAEGDLDVEVPVKSRDEIGKLAADFNEMVRRLQHSRAQIHYLQKISAWQEIARRLAHEIKNPLTPIRLAIEQVHDTYEGGDERFGRALKDANEIIHEEVAALQQMVEEFSAFAKLPQVSPQEESVDELMEEFARFAESAFPDCGVFCAPVESDLTVLVDSMVFRRVLHNLVLNAVQACKGEGIEPKIELSAHAKTKQSDTGGEMVEFFVEDNGPGVSSDLSDRIFDPYFTTKDSGTGLGLAIVKKILLEHDGSITVEESSLGGARFVIRLPSG